MAQNIITQNKTAQKVISTLIIISVFIPIITFFSFPQKADAQMVVSDPGNTAVSGVNAGSTATSAVANTTNTGISIANVAKEVGKQILMTVARKALQGITKSTINWINNGFHGNPLFIENPSSFFTDVAKTEIKNIVDTYGYDPVRFPFGKAFALNIIDSYKRKAADNAAYTLSQAITDPVLLHNYQNNFNVGGWNGFLINTQYPQNNYLGYTMMANNDLSQKLNGTVQNAAQKVQTTLQQGQGFLSPQTCPSNPAYNNLQNEFQKPSFDLAGYTQTHPFRPPADPSLAAVYTQVWTAGLNTAKQAWASKNTCPGGLVSTTPGTVVASKITKALGIPEDGTLQAMGVGTSISAILDSLLNHFLDKGLNALASTVNPKPASDTWSYDGQTLGSPDSAASSWDAGPDEPIILSDFKQSLDGYYIGTCSKIKDTDGVEIPDQKDIQQAQCAAQKGIWKKNPTGADYIPGDIARTNTELALLFNPDPSNLGVIQYLSLIWPKAMELDRCVPGPDLGWQKRLTDEMERNSKDLQEKQSDNDPKKSMQADLVYGELKFAVGMFKDWIGNKMMLELKDSITYMDAVSEVSKLVQESTEITNQRQVKIQTLARLQAIKTALDSITTQPAPGSNQEKVLISLKKQYNATNDTISSTISIENTRNILSVDKEKYARLKTLLTECTAERKAAGWAVPGSGQSWTTFNAMNSPFRGTGASSSSGTGGTGTSIPNNGTGNDTNPPPPIDLNQVVWGDADVSKWVETAKLNSVTIGTDSINLNYDKANSWTPVDALGDPSAMTVGNAWIFVYKNGQWEAATFDWLRPGQTQKDTSNIRCGSVEGTLHGLYNFKPIIGETYGFMVSGVARNGAQATNEQERSNIIMQKWTDPTDTNTCTSPSSTPTPPSGTVIPGTERLLFCDLPIQGGYNHASFTHANDGNSGLFGAVLGFYLGGPVGGAFGGIVTHKGAGSVTYPDLPYVNARNVLSWPRFGGLFGTHKVNIEIDCGIVFRSTILDYKGDFNGLTTVVQPYEDLAPNLGAELPTPVDNSGGGVCVKPPGWVNNLHLSLATYVTDAKNALAEAGVSFAQPPVVDEKNPTPEEQVNIDKFECARYEIVRRAAQLMRNAGHTDAGLHQKGGNNCDGFATDIIAFDDQYLYDVLGGQSGVDVGWSDATCSNGNYAPPPDGGPTHFGYKP